MSIYIYIYIYIHVCVCESFRSHLTLGALQNMYMIQCMHTQTPHAQTQRDTEAQLHGHRERKRERERGWRSVFQFHALLQASFAQWCPGLPRGWPCGPREEAPEGRRDGGVCD